MFTAKDVATQLNTDPKTLRRFLRQDVEYRNPGSGGRWMFTEADVEKITPRFEAWQGRPRTTSAGKTMIDDLEGLPARVIRSKSPADRAAVKKLSEERVDRLEAALRQRGLHVSQMKDRDFTARGLGIMS